MDDAGRSGLLQVPVISLQHPVLLRFYPYCVRRTKADPIPAIEPSAGGRMRRVLLNLTTVLGGQELVKGRKSGVHIYPWSTCKVPTYLTLTDDVLPLVMPEI